MRAESLTIALQELWNKVIVEMMIMTICINFAASQTQSQVMDSSCGVDEERSV